MKKRLICLLFALAFAVCGCESDKTEKGNPEELNKMAESINSEEKLSGDYLLEITFGDKNTLYFSKGEMAWDRTDFTAYARFDQTYLGISGNTENFFKNGKMISVSEGEVIESDRETEELFSKYPYCPIPLLNESCGEIELSESSVGTAFSFNRSDTAEISKLFLEDEIYDLVGVLKKPQKDLTEFSDAECIYTVKDGAIVSCRYEFDITLYDTPPYVPGYSVPEEEYVITVHVSAKITYGGFGSDVTVKEYSEDVSKEESSNVSN